MVEGAAAQQEGGSAATVFVSYASQDREAADGVVSALEKGGVRCWIAPRDVIPGEFYADSIVHAIDAAPVFVLILSRHASASPHVLREVERAVSKRRAVLSLRIDLAPLPAALEYFLNTSQWLDASHGGFERSLPTLTDAVRRTLVAGAGPSGAAGVGVTSPATETVRPPAARPARGQGRALLAIAVAVVVALGYFALDAVWLSKRVDRTPAAHVAEPGALTNSIAVLPFVDMSEKKDQEYFADGMAEELIELLAKAPGLHVIARTSSFSFKGKSADIATIANRLKVSHVLEGSVRKAGERLRIATQLVRADTGEQVWSESYDRELNDVFRVQDEIAAAVVGALRLRLAAPPSLEGSRGTSNLAAYNEFLLGRQFMSRRRLEDLKRAVAAYSEAVKLDPTYAAAYAELVIAQVYLSDVLGDERGRNQAEASADKAIELAPARAEGYSSRGWLRTVLKWDWSGAEADLRKAVALDPADSVARGRLANLMVDLGRFPEATACAREALELDPLNATVWGILAVMYTSAGDLPSARTAVKHGLEIQPEDPFLLSHLGDIELLDGHAAAASESYRKVDLEFLRSTGLAMAEHTLGNRAAADHLVQHLVDTAADSAAYQIALVFAWRNEDERALHWLERAYAQRDGGLEDLKVQALLRNLRTDARYKALLHKMNLPD